MTETLKNHIRKLFHICGLDIKRISRFQPYEWLKKMDIHTIFDIGANTGQFASEFRQLFPEAEIFSFEPLVDCYNELMKKITPMSKSHAFNFALGDSNGKTQIYHNDHSPSSSLLPMEELHKKAFPYTIKTSIEEISIRRLDDVTEKLKIRDKVLVKIDVQGTEDKVIFGGENIISRAAVIIIETSFQPLYTGQLLFDNIYELLKQRGFIYFGTEHTLRHPQNGSILQSDSLFCRKDLANPSLWA